MRKMKRLASPFLAACLLTCAGQAAIIRGLEAGFGGITALGDMGHNLEMGFAGSLTVKGPKVLIPIDLYLGASVQKKKGTEGTRLVLLPVFLSTRIDLGRSAPAGGVRPYLRLGLGGIFESGTTSHQGGYGNVDPGALLGLGLSKSLGRKMSLALDASYIFVFQTCQEGSEYDGHFITLGLGLDWMF